MVKSKVFISHSEADRTAATQMSNVLEEKGIKCCRMGRDVPLGEEWDKWITKEIKLCRAVVVIISENANNSDYVRDEVLFARQQKKKIIPFVWEKVDLEGILKLLDRRERIDASEGEKSEKLSELADRLGMTKVKRNSQSSTARRKKTNRSTPLESVSADGGCVSVAAPKQKTAKSKIEFRNPYEFDVAANSRTFKGRSREIDELLNCVESRTHAAVFGLQRMGKTSLVEEGLGERLQEISELRDRVLLCSVNFQEIGDNEVKYRDLMSAIIDSAIMSVAKAGLGKEISDIRASVQEIFSSGNYFRGDRSEIFQKFSMVLSGIAKQSRKQIVLFMDEFSEVRKVIQRNDGLIKRNPNRTRNLLPHDMFIDVPFIHQLGSLLKDRNLKECLTLIVAVRPFMAEFDEHEELQLLKLLRPITLYYLDDSASDSLIREPVDGFVTYEQAAVDYLKMISRGHPYLLQFILKMLVDQVLRDNPHHITLEHVKAVENKLVSEGPAYDAQFNVLISDYSVDEVSNRTEAELGRGALAIVAKHGTEQPEGWVQESQIVNELVKYKMPVQKAYSLLSQLSRTKILEEDSYAGGLRYRMYVPLLRRRFVKQNLYHKYFRQNQA